MVTSEVHFKMEKEVKLAIIGAGTAGLSAYKEASKYTRDIVVIDKGPLGSTCARVGCMPSKVFIQAANDFHHRYLFKKQGIKGSDKLIVNVADVLEYVRSMRDHFTEGVIEFTQSLHERFLCEQARFIAADVLQAGPYTIKAEAIIIANGSHSIFPAEWSQFRDKILTSETFFEQKNISNQVGLIGAGSIGLELGQALSRLGVQVTAYHGNGFIGGLSDPKVNDTAVDLLTKEFPIFLNEMASVVDAGNQLCIKTREKKYVDQVIAAMGRKPNLEKLGLENLGIVLNEHGIPDFDSTTMQVKNHSIFIAGDVNQERPLLHEAADEGRIAAFNALNQSQCFRRRTPLRIIFTEPNIAVVGKGNQQLQGQDFIIGEIDFTNQGRAKVMQQNKGLLRIYADKKTAELLGAELIAPEGEHLAHLLAWAIDKKMTAFDVLQMPFYHPVIEEGMRTALRQITKEAQEKRSSFDLAMCDSEAIHWLS
ncbi:MAG: dihydrolipoyl dehydrogenase [Alphaproteobacteria bacterium]|nr:dihydrolipoyl dehydrogenase [Alphaproteobacteria bacterium]